MLRLASIAVVLAACGSVQSDQPTDGAPPNDNQPGDGPGGDSSTARCDPAKPFDEATLVPNINTANDEQSFGIVRDESVGFVNHVIQPPNLTVTILATTATAGVFGAPTDTVTSAINGVAGNESAPSPTADGLVMYFHRQVPGGGISILAATRANATDAFSAGTQVTADGQVIDDGLSPTISADGQTLYWIDFNDFGRVFAATRGNTPTLFTNRREVSTILISGQPILSADELTLFYSQGNGTDVLESTRNTTSEMFGTGVPVANVNSNMEDSPAALSFDGCVLYMRSTRGGGLGGDDIWVARRPL